MARQATLAILVRFWYFLGSGMILIGEKWHSCMYGLVWIKNHRNYAGIGY